MTEAWKYEPAADLDTSLVERLRRFPREPDMLAYGLRSLAALALRGWLRVFHRYEVEDAENLPKEGSFVLIANHASHLDALCLTSALPLAKIHRAFPAAAADYFFESVPRLFVAAIFINALPFAREVHVRQSLALCRGLLSNPGNVLIIFPEGTRSKTGEIGRFKPGIGALVAGTNIPVVPCYLEGAYRAWPKGALAPRPAKLRLRIGRAVYFGDVAEGSEGAREVAARLEEAVRALRG